MPASALVEASNVLSARMVGRTIEEAQGQLSAEVERHRSDLDELTRRLVEAGMATSTGDGSRPALIVSGTERLPDYLPALEDLARNRGLSDALAKTESCVRLMVATAHRDGRESLSRRRSEPVLMARCCCLGAPN